MCYRWAKAATLLVAIVAASASPSKQTLAETIEIEDARVSLIQNATIAAPIAGVVGKVHVSEGELVFLDTPLAQLDDDQVRTELVATEAAYEAARLEGDNDVDARYAKRSLEVRMRELEQSLQANEAFTGAISETEVEKQRLVVDQSRLAIEQAQHQQNVAKAKAAEKRAAVNIAIARVKRHAIRSTVAGTVVEITVQPGEWAEAGKPIVRLISLDPIRVECFVDGRKHGPELVGRKVEFIRSTVSGEDPSEAVTLSGSVTFVSPELHPVTGQARLWATIANPDTKVRAGMRGRMVIK